MVVGAGVRPDAMLAERAGLEVDERDRLRLEARRPRPEGIYAAGDCCSYESVVHGRRLRVEHWDVAMQQGMHAARNMLGEDGAYRVVPYFFSDLADWASLEYVGPADEWDEEIWRGDRDGGRVPRLVPEGRQGRRRAQRRPLRRPGRGAPAARRRRRRLGATEAIADADQSSSRSGEKRPPARYDSTVPRVEPRQRCGLV